MTKIRYTVKPHSKGLYGVYDNDRGSYPIQTDDLRAIGVDFMDWSRSKEEAQKYADLLNGFKCSIKALGAAAAKTADSLSGMSAALIADQEVTA